ncbi:MAG: Lar family restriction alleviation protein [Clostridia bacterium]|nr:Lar family restriction alleviation protein [Clostridia bacterium]
MTKLKPCPFCGGEAVLEDCGPYYGEGRFFVRCSKCDIVQEHLWATKQTAIKAWNRRVKDETD